MIAAYQPSLSIPPLVADWFMDGLPQGDALGYPIRRLWRGKRKDLLASPTFKTVLQEFEPHGATLRRRSRARRASQVADRLCH